MVAVLCGGASQEILEGRQTVTIEQQNKANTETQISAPPQQPTAPTRVTIDGSITVANQRDPQQQQRDAEQSSKDKFDRWIDGLTLLLLAIAAAAAYGAYRANRRSADAVEDQVKLLTGQIREMQAGRRAWVSIEDVKLIHPTTFTTEGVVFAVMVRLKNLGQTPATRVVVTIESQSKGGGDGFMDAHKSDSRTRSSSSCRGIEDKFSSRTRRSAIGSHGQREPTR